MSKIYNNWAFQLPQFEIPKEQKSNDNFIYKIHFQDEINSYVGERIIKNETDRVYYYNTNIENVIDFHSKHYSKINLSIIKKLSEFVFLMLGYDDFHFAGCQLFEFNQAHREVKNSIYNEKYELQQYSETVYENGIEIEEKVFIPSLWKIHKERLI